VVPGKNDVSIFRLRMASLFTSGRVPDFPHVCHEFEHIAFRQIRSSAKCPTFIMALDRAIRNPLKTRFLLFVIFLA
jgi:hypothetical protein